MEIRIALLVILPVLAGAFLVIRYLVLPFMRRVEREMHLKEITIAYGMTETSPVSTQTWIGDPVEKQTGTVGKAHPHVEIKIVDADGNVDKVEIVDLMNIADPHDLNGDGSATFTFPYVTIEDILILDSTTILVMNDNNFPGGGGRTAAPDINEFLKIKLDKPLALQQPAPLPGHARDGRDEQDDEQDTDRDDHKHKR